ncbi:MAG: hypothetical protein AB7F59_10720 [Bdellovibrionales bacterium]
MNKFRMVWAIVAILLLTSTISSANINNTCTPTEVVINEVPFPKGTEIDFPWSTISGEWQTETSSFRISRGAVDPQGKRYLKVEEINSFTKNVLSEGVAVLRRGSKIASGLLSSDNKESFIILRSYMDKTPRGAPTGKSVLVITIRNLGSQTKMCDEIHQKMLKRAK